MSREQPQVRSAADYLPEDPRSLEALRLAAQRCQGCDLYKIGTRTVFGEGPCNARVMLVGEQPGDREDREGHPFVGPAGHMLDRALEEAGLDRARVYLTNAVKHFKWVASGARRLHKKPSAREVNACEPWLSWELEVVQPEVIVALGATAAQALLGRSFRVTEQRGRFVASPLAPYVTATVHPSSLLRAPDEETRRREYARFVDDLRRVAEVLLSLPSTGR